MPQTQSYFHSTKKSRSGSIKAHSAHVEGSFNSITVPRLLNNICSAAATPPANWALESRCFVLAKHAAKSACHTRHSIAVTETSSSGVASADTVNHFPWLLFMRM